jgi:hypothetical protein
MTGPTPDRIDRLARRFAGGRRAPIEVPRSDVETMSRASLLRYGALGILAVSLRGVPARASGAIASACRGGSLSACNGAGQRAYKATLAFCNKAYNVQNDPWGTAQYSCMIDGYSARQAGREQCKASCPKPKKPKPPVAPLGPAPPGPYPLPLPPPPPIPTCGQVDCVDNDVCCRAGDAYVCCAIGCARGGNNGCCSSDSDC